MALNVKIMTVLSVEIDSYTQKSLVESHGQVHGDQGHCSETTI